MKILLQYIGVERPRIVACGRATGADLGAIAAYTREIAARTQAIEIDKRETGVGEGP